MKAMFFFFWLKTRVTPLHTENNFLPKSVFPVALCLCATQNIAYLVNVINTQYP